MTDFGIDQSLSDSINTKREKFIRKAIKRSMVLKDSLVYSEINWHTDGKLAGSETIRGQEV